jgi:uncharacterized membrane protein YfcA
MLPAPGLEGGNRLEGGRLLQPGLHTVSYYRCRYVWLYTCRLVENRTGGFLIITLVYRHSGFKTVNMRLPHFVILGAVFGWLSAVVGTVGPLVAPFFLDYGLVGSAYIASEAMTAVVMHITKGIVYSKYALLGWDTFAVGMAMGIVMIFGSFTGKKIVDRLPRIWFTRIVEAVVLITGIGFLTGLM